MVKKELKIVDGLKIKLSGQFLDGAPTAWRLAGKVLTFRDTFGNEANFRLVGRRKRPAAETPEPPGAIEIKIPADGIWRPVPPGMFGPGSTVKGSSRKSRRATVPLKAPKKKKPK